MAGEEAKPEAQQASTETQPELAPPVNERFKWYIIHAYSGFERKVRESIESRVQAFGLQDRIGRIMIPTEPVTEIAQRQEVHHRARLSSGLCAGGDGPRQRDSGTWSRTRRASPGFLGTGDKPVALTEEEVSSILFRSRCVEGQAAR